VSIHNLKLQFQVQYLNRTRRVNWGHVLFNRDFSRRYL